MTSHVLDGPPPTFVLPALAAGRWALMFITAIAAAPAPAAWAWLCLIPFIHHLRRALTATDRYVRARVRLQHRP